MSDLEKYYKLALNIVNLDSSLQFITYRAGKIIKFEVPSNVVDPYFLTYSVKSEEIEVTKSYESVSCSPYVPENINDVIAVIKEIFSDYLTKQLLEGIE